MATISKSWLVSCNRFSVRCTGHVAYIDRIQSIRTGQSSGDVANREKKMRLASFAMGLAMLYCAFSVLARLASLVEGVIR